MALFNITNKNIAVQITNFGARLVTLFVPDKAGSYRDVIWGHESIADYMAAGDQNSGPIVGRYGNRINKGKFTLNGKEYQTTINDNGNHLHGGIGGFSTKIWCAKQLSDSSVVMSYTSADGEEGYPGEVKIDVTYTATSNRSLRIDYYATSDAPTVINPTSHAYFNLTGSSTDAMSHTLFINADSFTPTDAHLIPTGDIWQVEGTPMDFRTANTIGDRVNSDYEPIVFGGGYDHNWIFTNRGLGTLRATLHSPESGISMDLYTDQPAVQFYSGNFMDGKDVGKRGDLHNYRSGIALEAQNYPDAPNHPNFPSSLLNPGEAYTQVTIYSGSR